MLPPASEKIISTTQKMIGPQSCYMREQEAEIHLSLDVYEEKIVMIIETYDTGIQLQLRFWSKLSNLKPGLDS